MLHELDFPGKNHENYPVYLPILHFITTTTNLIYWYQVTLRWMHVRTCHCLDSEGVTNRKELEPFQVYFLSLYSSVALYCSAFIYMSVDINCMCVCVRVCVQCMLGWCLPVWGCLIVCPCPCPWPCPCISSQTVQDLWTELYRIIF